MNTDRLIRTLFKKRKKTMPFGKWGYEFRGPYPSADSLQTLPGILVVWCRSKESWTPLYVGEYADVQDGVSSSDRADLWQQKCSGEIFYSVLYTPDMEQPDRKEIAQKIRALAEPLCSED